MAVQFSLSYDANGDPVLVENTVTGTRKVVSTSPVVSEYKSRFETPASEDTNTDTDTDTSDGGSDIYRYINEMENNADNDLNLSFVDKQNLQRYTPEAMEAKGKPKSRTQSVMETIALAMLPYGQAAAAVVKGLSKLLPQESEEIKAIKQFYADPEQAALVESIPGMSNYNLVYGNPFDPSYGLANAAQKRIDRINKTLMKKDSSVLRDRRKKLQELIDRENKQQDDFRETQLNPTKNLTSQQKDLFRGGGADRNPPSAPQKATETASYGNQSAYEQASGQGGGQDSGNQGNNNSGNTSATDSSKGNLGFSDIRLKENVELIGKSPSNINIYKFNYKYNPTTYQGAMAHEVPWASVRHSNGYMMIDYNKIDVQFKRI